jgi:adenylylsulfate kinase
MSGVVVWLTGLPRSGKSTMAQALADELRAAGRATALLDGDEVRATLVPRPGYDPTGRDDFYATLGGLAALLARQGLVVLVAATAHRRAHRDAARARSPRFLEVHVATPIELCRGRDPAGLYRSAARDALPGVGAAYEPPLAPEVVVTDVGDAATRSHLRSLIEAEA